MLKLIIKRYRGRYNTLVVNKTTVWNLTGLINSALFWKERTVHQRSPLNNRQLLIGIATYFVSPYFSAWENGMGAVMKDSTLRLYLVEHPTTNILAIVLITMGWSLHKKAAGDRKKYFRIAPF